MRVFISYSPNMTIAYCFWKYFFQSCGIWVTPEEISDEWVPRASRKRQMIILDSSDEIGRRDMKGPDVVYCVGKKREFYDKRADVVEIDWKGNAYFQSVLDRLMPEKKKGAISVLMDVFCGADQGWKEVGAEGEGNTEGLWGVSWLFHEIAQSGKGRWDEEIVEKCSMALELLDRKKAEVGNCWNYRFMKLYYEYIMCGAKDRSILYRREQCGRLLEKCRKLEKGKSRCPALDILTGRICSLSSIENKYAAVYYISASEYDEQASVDYDIGHIYEKLYGDYKMALFYYNRACICDKKYYRALYKIAVDKEDRDLWMGAMGYYVDILEILEAKNIKNSTSICEIEYKYKTNKRLLEICRKNINDNELISQLEKEIEEMSSHLEKYVDFSRLMGVMFGGKKAKIKCQEIIDELHAKLNETCCQM